MTNWKQYIHNVETSCILNARTHWSFRGTETRSRQEKLVRGTNCALFIFISMIKKSDLTMIWFYELYPILWQITCPWKYNWLQNYHALCTRVFYACPTGIFEWSFNASAHTKCKKLLQIIRLPPIICLRASLGEKINQDLLIYSFETRYLQIYLRWI